MYDYDISEKFFGLFQSYKDSIDKLNGVLLDYENLSKLSDTLEEEGFPKFQLYLNSEISKAKVLFTLTSLNPSVVWLCGHGELEKGENLFLMGNVTDLSSPENIRDSAFSIAVHQNNRQRVLFVFDFCHSCTMINLKYYYSDGKFHKKVLDSRPTFWDDDPHLLRVSIAGASDFTTTTEDSARGGVLTLYLLQLIYTYGYISLSLFEAKKPYNLKECVITVNKPIEPEMPFIVFTPFTKKLKSIIEF